MNMDQIWDQLTKKDSRLEDPEAEIAFKSKNLRALLRQVWSQGEIYGKRQVSSDSSNVFDQLFDSMRGGEGR